MDDCAILCHDITRYVFDARDGFNWDCDVDKDRRSFDLNMFKSYYEKTYHESLDESGNLPSWIGGFTIILDRGYKSAGAYLTKDAKVENEKLYFTVIVND